MKAKILPLERSTYYGTLVEVTIPFDDGSGDDETIIKIWHTGPDFRPSARQLADWNVATIAELPEDYPSDSHFESQYSYEIAEKIVRCLSA